MTKTIHAIYENGVFRPIEALDLPDHCQVEFEIRLVVEGEVASSLDDVYDILSESFDGGQIDDAEKHNEHLP